MDEYIKRKEIRKAYEKLARSYMHGEPYIADWKFDEMIEELPTADVAPVRHGVWIRRKSCHTQTGFIDKCSVCQNMLVHLGCKTNYCPNCGAKMDGDDVNG